MPRASEEEVESRVVVPVVAEHASVEKKSVDLGGVRVTKRAVESVEHLEVPLYRDDVAVERRAVGEVVSQPPEARVEDGVTIVPVVEEVLVVERKYLVREEVRMTRSRTEGRAVADVPVTHEEVSVEELAANRRSSMNTYQDAPRPSGTSAEKVAVVNTAKSSAIGRKFPTGVLLLLVVLAVMLIALIAGIF
jgi:uncharacterized protein (TIGR02271 family)